MNRRNFLQTAAAGSTAFAITAAAHPAADGPLDKLEGHVFEFLGRSNQEGPAVTHFGYLTHIFTLADDLLFSDSNVRTGATARFTFSATTTLESRHEHGNIITTSAPGEMNLFLNANPGADFNDPASFARGQVIASYSTRYYNILNVQAPNQGVTTAAVELEQLEARWFTLGGHRFRLGRPGLRARLSANGQGTRIQADPLRAFFLVGGNAIITEP